MSDRQIISVRALREGGHIQRLQGRDYVLFSGLLALAHQSGLESTDTALVHADYGQQLYVVRATVTGSRGTYTGHGDASPANVNRGMASACLRMAETRALCRALRVYLGIGMTAREELPGVEPRQGGPAAEHIEHADWFAGQIRQRSLSPATVLAFCQNMDWGNPVMWQRSTMERFVAALDGGKFPDLYQPAEHR